MIEKHRLKNVVVFLPNTLEVKTLEAVDCRPATSLEMNFFTGIFQEMIFESLFGKKQICQHCMANKLTGFSRYNCFLKGNFK